MGKDMTNKDIQEAIFASGYLEQENEYLISANVDGIIISLPFKEGDSANKNDLIAIVKSDIQDSQMEEALAVYRDAQKSASKSSPELQQIEAQIDQAKYQLALDRDNYLRYKDLLDKNSVSQLDLDGRTPV